VNGRSLIVETVTRWVAPLIFLYGLNVVAYGHLSPGGGFAGGVVLACAFIILVLAWGKQRATSHMPFGLAKCLDSIGALLFLGLALLGMVVGGTFFLNVIQRSSPGEPLRLWNGGIIPLCNVAIAIKVCASLFLVMLVLSVLRVVEGGGKEDLRAQEEE